MNINFEYPVWFIIFCIAAGVGYSAILYYKNKATQTFAPWVRYVISIARAVALFLIALLLLGPLIKRISYEVQKPIIIVAQDNSASIVANIDSAKFKADYNARLKQFIEKLGNKYELRVLRFGDKVDEQQTFDYKDKQTELSGLFTEITNRYANLNVGAVVVASDGIFNRGSSPLYIAEKLNFPIFTVALGDTTIKKDLAIASINYNRTAYLGNNFPVEVVVDVKKLRGKTTVMTVKKGDNTLVTQNITVPSDGYTTTIPLLIEAKEKGLQKYRISFSLIEGETNTANNAADIYVNVLDARQKVLLLAAAPHPDIAALKNGIESADNYEVEVSLADAFTKGFEGYSLVIAHQIPSTGTTKLAANLKASGLPVLYVLGAQSSLPDFSNQAAGVSIAARGLSVTDAQPKLQPNFALFTLSDELKRAFPLFPPLQSPYGDYTTSNGTTALLMQQIGTVTTTYPLIAFNEQNGKRTGIICGEGLWRWRFDAYQANQSHAIFDELATKMVQYLAAKEDKSYFKVLHKPVFNENEPLIFDAELYNQSYELVNSPDIDMAIVNQDKKTFTYRFGKLGNGYRLNAGQLPPGEYSYTARTKLGDKTYTKTGLFSIAPVFAELANTVADHKLLYTLAQKRGGKMYYPNQFDALLADLEKRDDIVPVSYTRQRLDDMINLRWLFFILLGLLSLEWFLRKWSGSY